MKREDYLRGRQMAVLQTLTFGFLAVELLVAAGCGKSSPTPGQEASPVQAARNTIRSSPDRKIIDELLSLDASVRDAANRKVRDAIRADKCAELSNIRHANISWTEGALFPDVDHESVVGHSGPLRDFVIRSAAECGWWPQDVASNTIRCVAYERSSFGPTLFECVVDVVCHDDQTISLSVVEHAHLGDFEWTHVSLLYNRLTGRTKNRVEKHHGFKEFSDKQDDD